jgi:hypothetical protein
VVAHLLWGQAVGGSNPPSPTVTADLRAAILGANEETFRAWNAHDADALAAVFADDAELADVMAGHVIRGGGRSATTRPRFSPPSPISGSSGRC